MMVAGEPHAFLLFLGWAQCFVCICFRISLERHRNGRARSLCIRARKPGGMRMPTVLILFQLVFFLPVFWPVGTAVVTGQGVGCTVHVRVWPVADSREGCAGAEALLLSGQADVSCLRKSTNQPRRLMGKKAEHSFPRQNNFIQYILPAIYKHYYAALSEACHIYSTQLGICLVLSNLRGCWGHSGSVVIGSLARLDRAGEVPFGVRRFADGAGETNLYHYRVQRMSNSFFATDKY